MPRRIAWILAAGLLTGLAATARAEPGLADLPKGPPRVGRPDGDGPPGPPFVVVTEAQEAELLKALDEESPDEARQLRKLKEENPRAYRWALSSAWKSYLGWKDLPGDVRKAHLTQARVRVEAIRVSRELLAAQDPAQKEKLRARLAELLGQEFDAEQKLREYRLGQLEEQLRRLRAELKDRADRRAQVIERMVGDLLAGKIRPRVEPDIRRSQEAQSQTGQATSRPTK